MSVISVVSLRDSLISLRLVTSTELGESSGVVSQLSSEIKKIEHDLASPITLDPVKSQPVLPKAEDDHSYAFFASKILPKSTVSHLSIAKTADMDPVFTSERKVDGVD